MLILLLFICLVVVVGVVAGLSQAGMMPWSGSDGRRSFGSGDSMLNSPGCLLALIAASVVWFAAWGIVLVLSLRFLRSVI